MRFRAASLILAQYCLTYTQLYGRVASLNGTSVTLALLESSQEQENGEPPAKPDGQASDEGQNDMEPPQMPDGQMPSEGKSGSEPPQMPDGQIPGEGQKGNEPPKMPGAVTDTGETMVLNLQETAIYEGEVQLSADELAEGDVLLLTMSGDQLLFAERTEIPGDPQPMGQGGPGDNGQVPGGGNQVNQGTSANTLSEDTSVSGETYTSVGDDKNALRIHGAIVSLSNITVDKSAGASSNAEQGDFYGMNAALLATDGAQVTIENAIVTSSAQNGNGIFSYGSGTSVTVRIPLSPPRQIIPVVSRPPAVEPLMPKTLPSPQRGILLPPFAPTGAAVPYRSPAAVMKAAAIILLPFIPLPPSLWKTPF